MSEKNDIQKTCAYGNVVLVEKEAGPEKTELYVPDTAKDKAIGWWKVLSIGPDVSKGYTGRDGTHQKLKPGDRIQYHQGVVLEIDRRKYNGVPEFNILAVLPSDGL